MTEKPFNDLAEALTCPLSKKQCQRKQCPLWIRIWKPHEFPDYYFSYEGCGLIHTVPWALKKKNEKPQGSARVKISEDRFNVLKWEEETGAKLGDFQVAYAKHNLPDNWNHCFNILKANNSLIATPFKEEDYKFRYWIYPEKYNDKIFRKKLGEAKS